MHLSRILTCILLAVPALADTVVFRNVSVIPMTSSNVLANQTVVVKDGVIASVSSAKKAAVPKGATTAVPKGATVIDGSGKFLLPGLADMHVNIPPVDAKGELMPDVLTMLIANGVTTARGMWGYPGQLAVREDARLGKIVSPSLFLAGSPFSNQTVANAAEAAARVRTQKEDGWDLLKIHNGLTVEQYDAIAKTARETGARFGGSVPSGVSLLHAIEMGQESIDNMDPFVVYLETAKGPVDEKKLAELAKKLKDAGTWVVPTVALSEITFGATPLDTLKAYPEVKYSPNAAVDVWVTSYDRRTAMIPRDQATNVVNNNRRIIRAFQDAGVRMLVGTNTLEQFVEPGFSVMREMAALRRAGLTPYEVLQAATVNAAAYLGKQTSIGTIEAGKRADVVLLDANPLADLANVAKVRGVMVGGRWYARDQLDEGLKRIVEKYH